MRTLLRAAHLSLITAFVSFSFLLAATTSRAAAPIEKALPGNTIALVKIDDVTQLRQAIKSSQFGQMIADPAMKPFKDDLTAKLADPQKQIQAKIGMNLGEILGLPQGAVALAVVPTTSDDQPVALIVTADASQNAAKMADLMAKLTKIAQEDGKAKVTTESFKDTALTVIKGDKDDAIPVVWAQHGSVFQIATNLDAMKDLLANADGREGSLADSAAYQAIAKKTGDQGQISWFVSVDPLVKLVVKAMVAQGSDEETIKGRVQLTGINSLKAIGGRIGFHVGGYDELSHGYIYAPGEAQGLFKLFAMPPADLKPEAWVPASVAAYQAISFDFAKFWTALNEFTDALMPGALKAYEEQIAGPKGEGISLTKDVIGPLGKRITIISDFKKPIKEDSQRVLAGIALSNAKAFQNTLNKVLDMTGASPKKRDFQGVTIYDFDLPEMPTAPNANLPKSISITIAKDNLFITAGTGLLEQVLRGGPSLADSPEFQAMVKHYPDKSSTLSYQRAEESARAAFEMLKGGQFKQALQQMQQAGGPNARIADLLNFDKLPEFSVFAKYLTNSGGYSQPDSDGFGFTQFAPGK